MFRNKLLYSFLFILFFIFSIGKGSAKNNLSPWVDSNRFDIELFNKNRNKKASYSYLTTDNNGIPVKITLINDAQYYVEFIEQVDAHFTTQKKYDKNTLNLVRRSHTFYKIDCDNTVIYDSFGNLIQQIDENKKFSFSISQLRDLMLVNYNIDIYKKNNNEEDNYIVQRAIDPSIYYIKLPISLFRNKSVLTNGIRQDLYEIDGNTGEVLASPNHPNTAKNEMFELLKNK